MQKLILQTRNVDVLKPANTIIFSFGAKNRHKMETLELVLVGSCHFHACFTPGLTNKKKGNLKKFLSKMNGIVI